jgi:SAM-dependent methyltransferase
MSIEEDQDRFSRGAIEYLNKLDEDSIHYHYVKPYVGGPDFFPFFQDSYAFLNMVELLNLAPRSKILDFGCGTGWISIYLAKLGHIVTGIDISPQFITIAQTLKNNEKIFPFREQQELTCSFFTHNADKEPFVGETRFDCVILYSVLHHLVHPGKVLGDILKNNLEENGKIIIYEGVKPPAGSFHDKKMQELIDKYDTLERPFTPDELLLMLRDAGYDRISCYEPINGLFPRNDETIKNIKSVIKSPPTINAILAYKPAVSFKADIVLKTRTRNFKPGENITLEFELRNQGTLPWNHQAISPEGNYFTLGARLHKDGTLFSDSVPRALLPGVVFPGDNVSLEWKWTVPGEKADYSLVFDMVCEGTFWFSSRGSKEFIFNFTVN